MALHSLPSGLSRELSISGRCCEAALFQILQRVCFGTAARHDDAALTRHARGQQVHAERRVVSARRRAVGSGRRRCDMGAAQGELMDPVGGAPLARRRPRSRAGQCGRRARHGNRGRRLLTICTPACRQRLHRRVDITKAYSCAELSSRTLNARQHSETLLSARLPQQDSGLGAEHSAQHPPIAAPELLLCSLHARNCPARPPLHSSGPDTSAHWPRSSSFYRTLCPLPLHYCPPRFHRQDSHRPAAARDLSQVAPFQPPKLITQRPSRRCSPRAQQPIPRAAGLRTARPLRVFRLIRHRVRLLRPCQSSRPPRRSNVRCLQCSPRTSTLSLRRALGVRSSLA